MKSNYVKKNMKENIKRNIEFNYSGLDCFKNLELESKIKQYISPARKLEEINRNNIFYDINNSDNLKEKVNSLQISSKRKNKLQNNLKNTKQTIIFNSSEGKLNFEASLLDSIPQSFLSSFNNLNKVQEFTNPIIREQRKLSCQKLDFEKNDKTMRQNKLDASTKSLFSKQNIILYNKDEKNNKNIKNKIITHTSTFFGPDGRRVPYKNENEIYIEKKGKSNVCYFRDILASANEFKTDDYYNPNSRRDKISSRDLAKNKLLLPICNKNSNNQIEDKVYSKRAIVEFQSSNHYESYIDETKDNTNKNMISSILPNSQIEVSNRNSEIFDSETPNSYNLEIYYSNLKLMLNKASDKGYNKSITNRNLDNLMNENSNIDNKITSTILNTSKINTATNTFRRLHSTQVNDFSRSNLDKNEFDKISSERMRTNSISTGEKVKHFKIFRNIVSNSLSESTSKTDDKKEIEATNKTEKIEEKRRSSLHTISEYEKIKTKFEKSVIDSSPKLNFTSNLKSVVEINLDNIDSKSINTNRTDIKMKKKIQTPEKHKKDSQCTSQQYSESHSIELNTVKLLSPTIENEKIDKRIANKKKKKRLTEPRQINTFGIFDKDLALTEPVNKLNYNLFSSPPTRTGDINNLTNYSNYNLTTETYKSNYNTGDLIESREIVSVPVPKVPEELTSASKPKFKLNLKKILDKRKKEEEKNKNKLEVINRNKDIEMDLDSDQNFKESIKIIEKYNNMKDRQNYDPDISEVEKVNTSNKKAKSIFGIPLKIKKMVLNKFSNNFGSLEDEKKKSEKIGEYEVNIINSVKILNLFLNKQCPTNFESTINKYRKIYVVLDGTTIFKAKRIPGKYLDIPSKNMMMSMPNKKERLEKFYHFIKTATKEFSNEKIFKSVFTMNGNAIFDLVDIPEFDKAIFISYSEKFRGLNLYKKYKSEDGIKQKEDDIKLLEFAPVDRKKIVKRRFRFRRKRVKNFERKNLKPDNHNVRSFRNKQKRKVNNNLNNSFTHGYKFGKRLDFIIEDMSYHYDYYNRDISKDNSKDVSKDLILRGKTPLDPILESKVEKFDNYLDAHKIEILKISEIDHELFEYEYISDCEENINNRKLMLEKLYSNKYDLYHYFQSFAVKKTNIDIKNKYFNKVRLALIKRPKEKTKQGLIDLIDKYNLKRAQKYNINIKKNDNDENILQDTNKLMMKYIEKLIFKFQDTDDLDEFALEDGENFSERHFNRNKKLVENIHFQINNGVEKFYPDLISFNIPQILKYYPNMQRKELYEIFVQYKCLIKICIALNNSVKILRRGMDFETFYHAVPGMNVKGIDLAKKIFEVINERNNNHLSWDEFMKGMLNYKSNDSDEKIKMFFKIIDIKRNGLLTYQDVYDLSLASIQRRMGITGKDEVANELADYLANLVFKLMNITKDSKLNLNNLKDKILKRETEYEYLQMFLSAD